MLQGMYLKICKSGGNENICGPMVITTLFTMTNLWKPPRCPTTDEWIKKM
jgi:hypothetical protein